MVWPNRGTGASSTGCGINVLKVLLLSNKTNHSLGLISSLHRDATQKTSTDSTPRLLRSFFARSVHEVARDLIGATLQMGRTGGIIVEVEAYHHTEPAAHCFGGRTARNSVMFGPPGFAYVYRSHGIH